MHLNMARNTLIQGKMTSTKVLVTGGTGYIASHTVVQLIQAGFSVVLFDNLSNSSRQVVDRIEAITGQKVDFIEGDVRDRSALRTVFENHDISAVMHFAGLKAVGESQQQPLKYYDHNVLGSIAVLDEMAHAGVRTFVFSSSATVYGDPGYSEYREDTPTAPLNVYGKTKLSVENILRDLKQADSDWRIAMLRYFNPVGAHVSGMLGEHPNGVPDNLMPYIAQVAVGKRERLSIFGDDYRTIDGTGARDYVHVDDLAAGHIAALRLLQRKSDLLVLNLGTGRTYSVLEMVRAFERASGRPIPYEVLARRSGDLAQYCAVPDRARQMLGWQARYDCERMCADTWRWQQNNPNGY